MGVASKSWRGWLKFQPPFLRPCIKWLQVGKKPITQILSIQSARYNWPVLKCHGHTSALKLLSVRNIAWGICTWSTEKPVDITVLQVLPIETLKVGTIWESSVSTLFQLDIFTASVESCKMESWLWSKGFHLFTNLHSKTVDCGLRCWRRIDNIVYQWTIILMHHPLHSFHPKGIYWDWKSLFSLLYWFLSYFSLPAEVHFWFSVAWVEMGVVFLVWLPYQ